MIIEKLQKDIDWVIKIIQSCKNDNQLTIAEKCITLLTQKWSKKDETDRVFLISKLSETEKHLKTLIFDMKKNFLKKNIDFYT